MRTTLSQTIPALAFVFLLLTYGCKKDKHAGCYSAKVIHIGGGSADPCQSHIAVLLVDVEDIPAGTKVTLISHQTDLNVELDQTIYFTLHMRNKIVPGILRGCTLDPSDNFQIDMCE